MTRLTLCRTFAIATFAFAAATFSAQAATITVPNAGFESLKEANTSAEFGNFGGTQPQQVTDWFTTGYNYVIIPGQAISGTTSYAGGTYGTNFQLQNAPPAVPGGGNYLALDSDYGQGSVTTTLTGLTVGELVQVSFYIDGDQQTKNTPDPTKSENLHIGLYNAANQGQTDTVSTTLATGPWQSETVNFVATGSTETLSFLAGEGPGGVPSFVLLADVSASSVTPEPSSFALLGTGLLGVGGLLRRKYFKR